MDTLPEDDLWAQCERPDCKKWRKLPSGSVVDDNAPWFCEMNADTKKNHCSASEEGYNDEGWEDDVSLLVPASKKPSNKGKKRSHGKKGKSEPHRKKRRDDDGESEHVQKQRKKQNTEMYSKGKGESVRQSVSRMKLVAELKKRSHKFMKLLTRERMSGQDVDVNMMNPQHWKMLCTHAPEASHIACESANWASAAKYFKKTGQNGKQLFDLAQSLHQVATRFATAVSSHHVARLLLEAGEDQSKKQTDTHPSKSGAASSIQQGQPAVTALGGPTTPDPAIGQAPGSALVSSDTAAPMLTSPPGTEPTVRGQESTQFTGSTYPSSVPQPLLNSSTMPQFQHRPIAQPLPLEAQGFKDTEEGAKEVNRGLAAPDKSSTEA